MCTLSRSCCPFRSLLFLFVQLLLCSAGAQSTLPKAQHDSLWAVWSDPTAADTSRFGAIYQLVWDGYVQSEPDSAIHYAHLMQEAAVRKGLKDQVAAAMNLEGNALYNKGELDAAMDIHQRSLQIRTEIGDQDGISRSLLNIGNIHRRRNEHEKALDHLHRSMKIKEALGDDEGIAICLNNIGIVYKNQGDDVKAMECYERSLAIRERLGDDKGIAYCMNSMGSLYEKQGQYARAIECYGRSLRLHEKVGNKLLMASVLLHIGNLAMEQEEYVQALEHMRRSLEIRRELGDKDGCAKSLNQMGLVYMRDGKNAQAAESFAGCIDLSRELGDSLGVGVAMDNLGIVQRRLGNLQKALSHHQHALALLELAGNKSSLAYSLRSMGNLYQVKGDHAQALAYGERALLIAREVEDITVLKDVAEMLYTSYKAMGRSTKALEMYEVHVQLRDSLTREDAKREVMRHEFNYEFEKKEANLAAVQEKKDALAAEELRRKKLQRNAFIGGFGLMLLLAGVFFTQRNRISKERKRSDGLLLNILPSEVAEELKDTGSAAAKHFDQATILFSDFKGFTSISEKLSPADLVQELNACFQAFDHIITARGIEKIKTIGDAYMCVGGLPDPKSSSPSDVVHAALEMQTFMQQRKADRDAKGLPAFEMRVGIHTGPVVAGIVGIKKFQYDIWGDTVNIASRMESSGEVGQVNISEATYMLVKEELGLTFTPRGKVQAKGKGEMEMYFVKR
jgi:adenylate cyclase